MKFKVLDKLFVKGFIGPCLLAFFVVEFVLIMQYLWKEIDKIIGQGYGALDYVELLYYFGLVLIPMSLPLTILLSSVMVYGDMAEKYELSSSKSAGISLLRMLRPGLIVAFLVAMFSLLASNYLKPKAYEGYSSKIKAMKSNKLTFAFDEKIFNNDFKNFSIRVGEKEEDGRHVKDILIYDYSDSDKSIYNVIRAKGGEMYTSQDKRYLIMDLKDGYHFKEVRTETHDRKRTNFKQQGRPVLRYSFSSLRKVFDLEEVLDLSMTGSSYRKYEMMNSLELLESIDSFQVQDIQVGEKNIYPFAILGLDKTDLDRAKAKHKKEIAISQEILDSKRTSIPTKSAVMPTTQLQKVEINLELLSPSTTSLMEVIKVTDPKSYYEESSKKTAGILSRNINNKHSHIKLKRDISNYSFAFHRMYSWALVCILFLFIGGPAGAIVRKGGFGYPLLIAIGFYLTFVMTSIIGDKLVRSGSMSAVAGAWLPCLLLLPFAIYLTWRAMLDNRPIIKWRQFRK